MIPDPASFLAALGRASLAGGILVAVVLLAQRLLRRQLTPGWQCALWLLVAIRLLPFSIGSEASLFNFVPGWRPAVSAPVAPPSAGDAAAPAFNISRSLQPGAEDSATLPADAPAGASSITGYANLAAWAGWPAWLFLGWLAGAALLAGCILVQSLALRRALAGAVRVDDPVLLELLAVCAREMRVRKLPALVECDTLRSPALSGLLRPRLILPTGFAKRFSREEVRFVFLHELAHLRRGDLLLNWAMAALQVVHWFNPLVWFGFHRWRVDREIACDAAAIRASGAETARAYGHTILRLLEPLALSRPRVGVVGIVEDKRQLHRRLQRIADFSPARRPVAGLALLATLAVVGLTDAQVPQPTGAPGPLDPPVVTLPPLPAEFPPLTTPFALVLVSGSETMLGDTPAEMADWLSLPEAQRPASPKWQRTIQSVSSVLRALPAETGFQVVIFSGNEIHRMGGRELPAPGIDAIDAVASRLRNHSPRGSASLATALDSAIGSLGELRPERIVVVSDGVFGRGADRRGSAGSNPAQTTRAFEAVQRRLPPRIPVHAVLLPSSENEFAAGEFWALTQATRGILTLPARRQADPPTHLAFVIDASGSMRDPNRGGLWTGVIDTVETVLNAHPNLTGIQVIDGDGRFILGRRNSSGAAAWHPDTAELRTQIGNALRRYNQDTVSNPVPGVYNALRFLRDPAAPGQRIAIYLLGDEFVSADNAEVVLNRLDRLNPRNVEGRRAVALHAIGFPTTIRFPFSMGNTGLRYASLMQAITQEHDGSFMVLPEL